VARGYDLVNKRRPVVGPFLLQHGDQNKVELVEKRTVYLCPVFVVRKLDDEIDDKVADACQRQLFVFLNRKGTYLDTGRGARLSILS
jgi:hypothetical protein